MPVPRKIHSACRETLRSPGQNSGKFATLISSTTLPPTVSHTRSENGTPHARDAAFVASVPVGHSKMSRVGLEPTTYGLKVDAETKFGPDTPDRKQ